MRLGGVLGRLGVILTVSGCATAHPHTAGPPAQPASVAQPSDGWRPGQPWMLLLNTGPLHIVDGCARAVTGPTEWPDGFTVRGQDLLDASGKVVAHDGQTLHLTGGEGAAPTTQGCGVTAGQQVFMVEGPIT